MEKLKETKINKKYPKSKRYILKSKPHTQFYIIHHVCQCLEHKQSTGLSVFIKKTIALGAEGENKQRVNVEY